MTHERHEQRMHDHHGHSHGSHGHDDGARGRAIHPAWWIVLGVVLTLGAVLAWVGYPWF